MTRTIEEIMRDQNITMPALVKAANLNAQRPDARIQYGARSIAEALTNDAEEIDMIRRAIVHANNLT